MVRLAPIRPILEEDLERVLGNAGLEKTGRGDAALASLEREGEPANAFGRAISFSCRLERDLLGIRLERKDESIGRRIREPSRCHALTFGLGVNDHHRRGVLMREP